METEELKKHIEWIQHIDLRNFLASTEIQHPWFPAFSHNEIDEQTTAWFSALIPVSIIPKLIKGEVWDFCIGNGHPAVWQHYKEGKISDQIYCAFGNEEGIEPLVIVRDFHGIRKSSFEVSQEFRLYHNLYHDTSRNRYICFNRDGDETDAIKYSDHSVEIRTDLLLRFIAEKQMALSIFLDSFRYSKLALSDLGLDETRLPVSGDLYCYHIAIVPEDSLFRKDFLTLSGLIGKKYIMPGPMPTEDEDRKNEIYQEFTIGTDSKGNLIKYTCDPQKLSDYFGKNPESPNYLTPVFFRTEVLSKYYADPQKYSVSDGYISCGGLWGLRIDNDHTDCVVVYLGDLGKSLSENERNYWLSFNIPPSGKGISKTNFLRSFMAIPTNPQRPDLAFKHEFMRFCDDFRKKLGWDFFIPLHGDDRHFFIGLRIPSNNNQSEFDTQLLALTKVIVDSINEKEISKNLTTLAKGDKGIAKLEKFFREKKLIGYEKDIAFLRDLQELRSRSAAHRKGDKYEELVKRLRLADGGQQRVYEALLNAAIDFIKYLRINLLPK